LRATIATLRDRCARGIDTDHALDEIDQSVIDQTLAEQRTVLWVFNEVEME
jgi:hypothetical protein